MWASTLCPFSSWTRNIAFGSGSTTVPSSTIASSLGFGIWSLLDNDGRARLRRQPSQGTLHGSSAGHGKHLRPILGHRDGVLEVGGEAAVGRLHGPAVVQQDGAGPAHVDHGLDGEHVADLELDPAARRAVVGNLGFLVHGRADPVADVLPNHRVPGALGDALDGVADVGQPVAVADLGDGRLQALLGDLHHPAGVLADLTHGDRDGRVTVVALDDRPTVEGEYVALLQHVFAGDAVDDDVVGRRADHGREAVVVEEVRAGAAEIEHLTGDRVEIEGGHARLRGGDALLVHLGDHPARPAHLGDLLLAL